MNPQLNDDGMPIAPMTWAERLRRVFRFDITLCPDCGGNCAGLPMSPSPP